MTILIKNKKFQIIQMVMEMATIMATIMTTILASYQKRLLDRYQQDFHAKMMSFHLEETVVCF